MTDIQTELHQRLEFAQIMPADRTTLRALWPVISPRLPEILSRFYTHLFRYPHLKAMAGDRQSALENAQYRHWERIFAGAFDETYLAETQKIGSAHHRIGLEPRWYIGAYRFVLNELIGIILERNRFSANKAQTQISAVNKAILLDLDLAISTYQTILLEERKRQTEQTENAISGFQTAAFAILDKVRDAGGDLKSAADDMSGVVGGASENARIVLESSHETAESVSSVASATEELSKSINEVSSQISNAAHSISGTVRLMDASRADINNLLESARQIGEVVNLISDIASQTNLLALNATIEAARAGEAGRGFAVVASEVKTLATQTARATDDISRQINEIQAATRNAVNAIEKISDSMSEVEQITTVIAATAEEQGAATQEISRSIARASSGAQALSGNIVSVTQAIAHTAGTSDLVRESSDSLNAQAGQLAEEVRAFFVALRNGPLDRRNAEEGDYRGAERRQRA
ncbi:globin-coupled sensor protein [Asticcacaulis sp. AND118]|uniref:globin-coupled sensor protein n=1 Tax=Asticcacaulis sp. AND118 TaxID=2840468 RepID=UPI001CFFA545|nr:globin-coupled sensor protein [Asticcacaulis sp. AND118]UDF04294.1 globin-coupled sensor protein [Asticcacaulis sp. AND118]